MPNYQALNRYEQFTFSRYCMILHGVMSHDPRSRLYPLLANTIPSRFALDVIHRSGLRGHQISRPWITSRGGHTQDMVYQQQQHTREFLHLIMESANQVKRDNEIARKAINFLWVTQNCTYWNMAAVLNSNQCNATETEVLWYYINKTDVFFHVVT
jgi:hypothetical protein